MTTISPEKKPVRLKTDQNLHKKIEALSGQNVSLCFQCRRCTGGCPLAPAMDIMPHQLIHLLHLGQLEKVLASNTVWVCAACETCTTRCPNGIDIAHVIDTLRQITWERGDSSVGKNDRAFHEEFLKSIRQFGRVNELRMVTEFTFKTGGITGLMNQAILGLNMLLKGKFVLVPERFRGKRQIKEIFKASTGGKNK